MQPGWRHVKRTFGRCPVCKVREKRFLVKSFDEVRESLETIVARSCGGKVGSSTGMLFGKLSKMAGEYLGWLGRRGVAPRAPKSESLGS